MGMRELAAPNQVFFIHLIIFDSERNLAMTSGQTVVVTETGCRVLIEALDGVGDAIVL